VYKKDMISRREEDYLEAIYNLINEKGYAKTTHIANAVDVKPASATEMLQILDSKGFITYRKYEGARLTDKGMKIAEAVKGRHDALLELLILLQIPYDIADSDACTMEHGLNPTTIVQVKKFIQFVKKSPKGRPKWVDHFKEFSKTGDFPEDSKEE
jgi:DtxR family Mn-dependent transcriptional regulator